MARYTLEISQLHNTEIQTNSTFKIFDFEYDFYTDDLEIRKNFEKKFVEYYFYNEIGFETVGRWKRALKGKLDIMAPYYKQLYATELATKNINFMLNKDLNETYTRVVDNTHLNKDTQTTIANATNTDSTTSQDIGIESDTPQGSISNLENYMSSANKNNSNTTSNGTNNNTQESTATQEQNGKSTESYNLLSQGNIGITSSGKLLEDWRKILINIDQLIIEEMQDLFIQIF